MTLEDFFTLTEMKGGLTAPARVEELVAVMQKEKDSLGKNAGDATRQWSTVGSVISATENEACLDLFIQLDGLLYIDRWLKDAQTFSASANDSFVEESVLALLKALARLKIGSDRLKSSGIDTTIKGLICYKSSSIQDKVRALLESWKSSGEAVRIVSEEVVQSCGDDKIGSGDTLVGEIGASEGSSLHMHSKIVSDHHESHTPKNDAASSGLSGEKQTEEVEPVSEPDKFAGSSNVESDRRDVGDVPAFTKKLDADKVELLIEGEACISKEELRSQNSLKSEHNADVKNEGSILECPADVGNAELLGDALSEKLDASAAPGILKAVDALSTASEKNDPESVGKVVPRAGEDVDSLNVNSISIDEHPPTSDEMGVLKNCIAAPDHRASSQVEGHTNSLQGSSVNATISGKPVDQEQPHSQNDNLRSINKDRERSKDEYSLVRSSSNYGMPRRRSKHVNVISKTSAMDLEDGTVDALEVARLVAMEVEREVAEDDDEQFGNSSDRSSRSGTRDLADTPSSSDGKNDEIGEGVVNDLPNTENTSTAASHKEDEPSMVPENVNADAENVMQDVDSSQVTETALAPDKNPVKDTCGFDLNMEVCSEEEDVGNSVSNPVSVVSASRAVAASGLPASPLKFEGSLGWKGSAATSAFRPASPRKHSDGDRPVTVGASTADSSHKQGFVIDLNIAEEGDEKAANPVSGKPNLTISGLPCIESSVELSPRRFEKLEFDLNQLGEDGDVLPSVWKPFGPNAVRRSPSPASSTSSMKTSMRNFDLNDNPSSYNDPPEQQTYIGMLSSHKAAATYGGSSDDSIISIMGAKVKKGSFHHQTPVPFPNIGRPSDPVVVDPNLPRGTFLGAGGAVQYTPSPHYPPPVYGYNGVAVGPTIPFSSPMYGPGGSVAYMVDSRGMSLVPQLMGSPSSTMPHSFTHHPSFTANMMGPLPGPNGAGPSHSNVNLNSGFIMDGVNRDPGGFRQLYVPNQVRSGEENLQPFFPGGKRKEPDGGWGPYLANNYKHHQPPHL